MRGDAAPRREMIAECIENGPRERMRKPGAVINPLRKAAYMNGANVSADDELTALSTALQGRKMTQ